MTDKTRNCVRCWQERREARPALGESDYCAACASLEGESVPAAVEPAKQTVPADTPHEETALVPAAAPSAETDVEDSEEIVHLVARDPAQMKLAQDHLETLGCGRKWRSPASKPATRGSL